MAAESEAGIDPIHQFIISPIAQVGPLTLTNSALFMLVVLAVVTFVMIIGTSSRALVPVPHGDRSK